MKKCNQDYDKAKAKVFTGRVRQVGATEAFKREIIAFGELSPVAEGAQHFFPRAS